MIQIIFYIVGVVIGVVGWTLVLIFYVLTWPGRWMDERAATREYYEDLERKADAQKAEKEIHDDERRLF